MAGYGRSLVLDWSAYTQYLLARNKGVDNGRLSQADADRFEEAALAGELHVCEPFRMEALYSAQNPKDFAQMSVALDALPQAPATPDLFDVAIAIQKSLAQAKAVSHRVKLADLLVAAVAFKHDLGVLHYDKDYVTIAQHGGTGLTQVWIAKKGSLAQQAKQAEP